jgi:hypothetical protein
MAAGVLAVSLVTGVASNANAALEFSPHHVTLAQGSGHMSPAFPTARGALVLSAGLASELLSGPIAGALVSLAFEGAFGYADCEPFVTSTAMLRRDDAALVKAANADFDSNTAQGES